MLKHKLESIKQGDTNLYNHLTTVLKQLILSNDRDGYQLFEHYSQTVKQGHNLSKPYRNQQFELLKDYVNKTKVLLNVINVQITQKPNTGTEEEPAEPGPTGYVPNLMEEAKWFEKAGVGFGQETTYLIFKSLERFSILKQIKQLKFWGKIIGSESDYYIAESPAEAGGQQGQLPPQVEPKGTGINKTTYWVSTDLSGEWKQLPIITPQQLKISRKIKYIFTGNLNKDICTNPYFNGKQSHLLKCQIVRMVFSCTIVPRTMFNVNAEDKKQIQPAGEQWKFPEFNFLSELENWVHHPQNILKNGRLALLKPIIPQGVEVDQEKLMKQLELKDPLEQRLKPITKDQALGNNLWALRIYGDSYQYKGMNKSKGTINYGFICIRSLVWKGWTLVYHNKQWSSIYIGYGFKSNTQWYYPSQPEMILQQNNDRKEQLQPNFPPEEIKKPQNEIDIPVD